MLWVLMQVLKAVANAREQTQGIAMDALAALEKTQPLGFDYRDVSMPVHVFHGRADHMVRAWKHWYHKSTKALLCWNVS